MGPGREGSGGRGQNPGACAFRERQERNQRRGKGTPETVARLTFADAKGGKEGREPPPSSTRPQRAVRDRGGPPNTAPWAPTARSGPGRVRALPAPAACVTCAYEGGREAPQAGRAQPPCATQGRRKGGPPPPRRQLALPAHGMAAREGGDTPNQEDKDRAPPISVFYQRTACR